jgi:hypothetical protein
MALFDGRADGSGTELEIGRGGEAKKASSSFLKKRTKKLLTVAARIGFALLSCERAANSKSFLVLFFKKELLSFFQVPGLRTARVRQSGVYPARRRRPASSARP